MIASKAKFLFALLLFGFGEIATAFDTAMASSDRFKVSYVEPAVIPEITELPDFDYQRASLIENYQLALKNGASEKDLLMIRKERFQFCSYPIRVTDTETGNFYVVQRDRRTIIATKPNGDVIWKINPFEDAELKPYRMKHPFIYAIGVTQNYSNIKGDVLGIVFTSSQFGDIELDSGKFHFQDQD